MFVQHTTDSEMLQMKRTSQDEYLFVVGMHAFGAGVYVTHMQSEFKKPVNEFSPVELMKLAAAFGETDAYELALNTLGVTLESKKKKILDLIILTALKTLMNTCGDAAFDLQNILAYTQVLYNAGITMVYRS